MPTNKRITSFDIDHKRLKIGTYLHDVQWFGDMPITTFDLRFKEPNTGDVLTNVEMHSLEHLMATFYNMTIEEKIYFGPMGCQTGFYLVVYGNKNLEWLYWTFRSLDKYINTVSTIPGNSPAQCGNYQTLDLEAAKNAWNTWFSKQNIWGKKYKN